MADESTVTLRGRFVDDISPGIRAVREQIHGLPSDFRSAEGAAGAFTSGLRTMADAENSLRNSVQNSITDLRAQRSALQDPGFRAAQEEARKLRAEIEQMTAAQQPAAAGWMTVGNAVRGFIGLQVVGYIKDMGGAIFDATAEMQSLKMGMTAVMKSSTLANAELVELKETAKLPGLGYAEAIKMSVSLQSAGFSAGQARKSMEAFGNALATVGKGKADLDGVGLALTQIMSKGKVSAEEINQIAERVPQIRIAMQDAFGTASTEMIQAMGLSSGQFIRGVTDELGKLEKVTGGLKNDSENLSDAWFQLKANIGGSGVVFFQAISQVSSLIGLFNSGFDEMRKRANQAKIESAMASIAWTKKVVAEELAAGRVLTAAEQKLIDGKLNAQRAILASLKTESDAAGEKLTDGQKEILKREGAIKAKSRAGELAAEAVKYRMDLQDAKEHVKAKEIVEEEHKARLAEINARWDKKADTENKKAEAAESKRERARQAADAESSRLVARLAEDQAAETAFRERAYDKEARREEQEARAKDARKKTHDKRILDDEMRMERAKADFAEEVYQMQLARSTQVEDAWSSVASSTSAVWSEALMTMGTKHGDFYDTLSEGFSAMIRKMVADLVANAAIFGILSLIPGANAAGFAAGLGGLGSAILGSFDVGTRALPATGPIIAHKDEAIFPAPVSRAMAAGNWAPAMQFMGQGSRTTNNSRSTSSTTNNITIQVTGAQAMDYKAMGKVLQRATAWQERTRPKGSR